MCVCVCVHYITVERERRCETVIRVTEKREKGNKQRKPDKHTGRQKMSRPPNLSQEVVPVLSGFYFEGFSPGGMCD